jgi:glycosyltransferase involved in cell wall biosynthesis
MKKRILMCTEASFYPTGYGVYTKELLSRLHKNPNFEVAELSCYVSATDPRLQEIPWHVFPNKPVDGSPEMQIYNSYPTAEYGEFSFNNVCLNFMPDFVIDIRDPWAFEFQTRSPFRQFFKHVIMPTVDAEPQNPDWIDMFGQADAVFTYSEFGAKTIQKQSQNINYVGVASPCASSNFFPFENKEDNRARMGLPTDIYIVGTVMRNQRRKLYPELFESFRKYLDETKRNDVYLYCHTSFPDVGWCIPELLMSYDLSTRVLFTYKCKTCGTVSPQFFNDAVCACERCGNFTNTMIGVGNGVSEPELAQIYNLFDIYVQYANSEGFGMPQLEAARCGNVVMSVNYSAMSSIIDNIDAIPIRIGHLSKECETGCMRVIPDSRYFIETLKANIDAGKDRLRKYGLAISENAIKFYNWDRTAAEWEAYLMATPTMPMNQTWLSQPRQHNPAPFNENIHLPTDKATYLIRDVLGRPDLVGKQLWRRLLKDLTYGTTVESAGNQFYFNESHLKDNLRTNKFSFKDAYDSMVALRDYYNVWEGHRMKAINR